MANCYPTSLLERPSKFYASPLKINVISNLTGTFPSQIHSKFPFSLHLKPPPASSLFMKFQKPHQPILRTNKVQSLFTGIVEEMGTVKQLGFEENSFTMKIQAKVILEDIHLGDSISVNGTCLTVTDFDILSSEFSVGLSPETLRKTSLGELNKGSYVNLERALSPSTRMGGHFVQGHVDGTGEIVDMTPEGDSLWVKVKTGKELLKYIVPKGFIAIDGTSLTVVDVSDEEGFFNFMLVEYTQQKVVIPLKKIGEKVNLEVDILGKYVERILSYNSPNSLKSQGKGTV